MTDTCILEYKGSVHPWGLEGLEIIREVGREFQFLEVMILKYYLNILLVTTFLLLFTESKYYPSHQYEF